MCVCVLRMEERRSIACKSYKWNPQQLFRLCVRWMECVVVMLLQILLKMVWFFFCTHTRKHISKCGCITKGNQTKWWTKRICFFVVISFVCWKDDRKWNAVHERSFCQTSIWHLMISTIKEKRERKKLLRLHVKQEKMRRRRVDWNKIVMKITI